jgi:hypothetical protein
MLKRFLFTTFILLFSGCDGIPGASLTSTTRSMFLVSGVEPAVGAPGSLVKVIGSGFDKSLQMSSPSGATIPVFDLSPLGFSFTVPADAKGIVQFVLSQGDGKVQLAFIASGSNEEPLLVGSGKSLCKQQQYMTLTGESLRGELDCVDSNVTQLALVEGKGLLQCATDGQEGCMTNADFPSVEKNSLSYRVAPGKTVAGVLGQIANSTECPK